ncbi:hypothetical protein F2P81_010402 [Scophthalmus maximus]|uniref:Uncharacterized protein n=1 Tax=Scophthalmus maximus TaxID=52904 RepID=A0A6A4SZR1_SCOMX|nr:hypothetical protein F2P81_010402 [Scophthalmus maximus]
MHQVCWSRCDWLSPARNRISRCKVSSTTQMKCPLIKSCSRLRQRRHKVHGDAAEQPPCTDTQNILIPIMTALNTVSMFWPFTSPLSVVVYFFLLELRQRRKEKAPPRQWVTGPRPKKGKRFRLHSVKPSGRTH